MSNEDEIVIRFVSSNGTFSVESFTNRVEPKNENKQKERFTIVIERYVISGFERIEEIKDCFSLVIASNLPRTSQTKMKLSDDSTTEIEESLLLEEERISSLSPSI